MMINKRLINTVKSSKKYIAGNVVLQWCSLIANILTMYIIANYIQSIYFRKITIRLTLISAAVLLAALIVRFFCTRGVSRMSYLSSKTVKKMLRERIYKKLLKLGPSYKEKVKTSEVVQVSVEGVDQLEIYFGAYLPQFFYSMIAPVTLFIVLSFIDLVSTVVLLICVPLIPVAIAAVQTWAKKLLSKYWNQYTSLGDTFLENLQGLTTLKIYRADEYKNDEMNIEAEKFRKITMKVLTMQLNSITIMDLVAYGGAALGIITAVARYSAGNIELLGCIIIILLSADFFIPMRQLGSFFHIAMNGMAASDKIFRLLDLPENGVKKQNIFPQKVNIALSDLHFSYDSDREILHGINIKLPKNSFTAIVGESGSGKSTIASILMGRNRGYTGSADVGGIDLVDIDESSLMKNVTYVGHNSYLFKGSVRDNMLMAKPEASDEELWSVLEKVKLSDFLKGEKGLETKLLEGTSNFSGGQRQRLALARALLHDSPVYIFDEATSNIDVESENDIMEQINELVKSKTVLLISHRLANTANADSIYVLSKGNVVESGTHEKLILEDGVYAKLWHAQQQLENFAEEVRQT